jgi:sulfatase maturation enzyme AslB (radical SAM superfamily)
MKCAAFWKHTNIRPGNRVYPCCRFKQPIAEFDGDFNSVLDIPEYQELRRASAKGEWILGCEKCYWEEELGHKSLREEFNEVYDAETVGLEFLEIGLDNLCNLTCDGCNSEFSTSWIAKEKRLFGKANSGYQAVEDIRTLPASLKKILFLGGEPLITRKHLDVLSLHPNPNDCTVIYNTNATFIPSEECLEKWKEFKKIHFIVSIDGVGKVNEQVRSGTKWQSVVEFIEFCQNRDFDFEFNTVLHYNNIFDLENLINFVTPFNKDWYINILTYPDKLSIRHHDKQSLQKYLHAFEQRDFPNKQFITEFIRDSL